MDKKIIITNSPALQCAVFCIPSVNIGLICVPVADEKIKRRYFSQKNASRNASVDERKIKNNILLPIEN